jgi:hypothetical protein
VETQEGGDLTPDWTHVVAVDRNVLFVRRDGVFAVAHINSAGQLVETQVGSYMTPDWTHIVAV